MATHTTPTVTSADIRRDGIRTAAARVSADLGLIKDSQLGSLSADEQAAIVTTRFVCDEFADGDRRVI